MKQPLVIFGSAEIASLAKLYFNDDSEYEVVGFTVDDEFCDESTHEGLPLIPFSKLSVTFPPDEVAAHVALSYKKLNRLREDKYHQMKDAGYRLASYVCSHSAVWKSVPIGDNCFILENQTIQPGCEIGDNVMMWSGNHIGHGTVIEDHVYLASHICISGHCRIGQRTFIGVNAATRDFCKIGSDCFIAMGSSITRELIEDGSVVLGAKGRVFGPDDEMGAKIRNDYFGLE